MKANTSLVALLTRGLVVTASIYLPMAEILTRVNTALGVSLNLVVSLAVAAAAAAVVLYQGLWPVVAVSVGVLLLPMILGIADGNALRHFQYSVPTFTFVVTTFIILRQRDLPFTQQLMVIGASLTLPTWVAVWIVFDLPLPRASAPVVPLAVLVLLYMAGTLNRGLRVVMVSSVFSLAGYLAATTARMSFAVTLVVLLIWIWTSSRWSPKTKTLSSTALVATSTLFWFGRAMGRERLFGRDASIGIGPVTLNGEGRVEAANLALEPASNFRFWQVVFGNGGGTSGQRLVDAGFILDKPHNEFLRAFVDGGLVLTAALGTIMLVPLIVGVLNYQRTGNRSLFLLPTSVSLILLGFSLTDNAMSYIWLMLPAGILVSWSRSRAVAQGASPGN